MPSTGFYLFLLSIDVVIAIIATMCQCPQRASTYFFAAQAAAQAGGTSVSMPSTGFYLFLPLAGNVSSRSRSCVNALNGLLLISSGALNNADDAVDVSMPSTGFYLFLQPSDCDYNTERYCVNALNGLLLISSVPSQNP